MAVLTTDGCRGFGCSARSVIPASKPSSTDTRTGLGQAWLARSQPVLSRIHRTEGSSSSGSSGRPQSLGDRCSYSTAEEARDAERATAEADARAHTADYVEARGMLIPAVDYYSRAVAAAERDGTVTGELLSEVGADAYPV